MQSIFGPVNKEQSLPWAEVESFADSYFELSIPHRWAKSNIPLGEWTATVRQALQSGTALDLMQLPTGAVWEGEVTQQNQIGACRKMLGLKGTTIAMLGMRKECYRLAKSLPPYSALETVECDELLKFTERFLNTNGSARLTAFADFVKGSRTNAGWLIDLAQQIANGKPARSRLSDRHHIGEALVRIRNENDCTRIWEAMLAMVPHISIGYSRRILWDDMVRCLKNSCTLRGATLTEVAVRLKDLDRHVGRVIPQRSLGTTLLVKGLECDNAIVLNADRLSSAEDLYVALTRGCKNLIILSNKRHITRALPRYLNTPQTVVSASPPHAAQQDLFGQV